MYNFIWLIKISTKLMQKEKRVEVICIIVEKSGEGHKAPRRFFGFSVTSIIVL